MDRNQFIFRDPLGSRWRRLSRGAVIALAALLTGLALFIYSLTVLPHLGPWPATATLDPPRASGRASGFQLPVSPRDWLRQAPGSRNRAAHASSDWVRLGFLDPDPIRAQQSLRAHRDKLTHVAPAWLRLSGLPPRLEVNPDPRIQELLLNQPVALMPTLSNLVGERFDPEAVEHYLRAGRDEQQAFTETLRSQLQALGAQGVVIGWEQVDPAYQDDLTDFIGVIHQTLAAADLQLWLSIPVGDDIKVFDLEALAGEVDRFVAALYYETGDEDDPGPIASLPWFKEWLDVLIEHGDPHQWVIGIGTFGYDWPDTRDPEVISFYDAMARATSAQATDIDNSAPFNGPNFVYQDGNVQHTVWFLDATSFRDHQRLVLERGLGGVAIDRLGAEDPLVWTALQCGADCAPEQFQEIPAPEYIATVGNGDFLQVNTARSPGRRSVTLGEDGAWEVSYQDLPRTPTATHHGDPNPNLVALSFDDGPDPEWTPRILDVLKARGIQATFFVIGKRATAHPDLVRRILDEGHALGNHTFSHADLSRSPAWRVRLELNATQRGIESITGRSTLLFRPPYDADRMPQSIAELQPLAIAQEMGYIPSMASIDPRDWQQTSSTQILAQVKAQRPKGNVILLHDGGGDRSATLGALEPLLDYLDRRGDQVVPMHRLLDLPRDGINPPIPAADPVSQRVVAGTGLNLLYLGQQLGWAFLVVSTILLLIRSLFLAGVALVKVWRERRDPAPLKEFAPPVSVVLAAYNEDKVVAQTLQALLASRYPAPFEVLLVDDGSQDRTGAIVAAIAAQDPRVRLLRQNNRGKASALQLGFAETRYPFIVTLDADTLFLPDTLTELVRPLGDPRVGAVSGNLRVGNRQSWIGRFQALEYLAGFNLDRRAYDRLNAITVVPGAASAYRAEAIAAAGGIQADTLAEDTDLTLALHQAGYLIRHTARAQAITEAPRGAGALLRQRQRWSFGTLQCLWKHRALAFDRRHPWLGLFAIPSIWFFHIFLVALVPVIDLGLILALLGGADQSLFVYLLAFLGIDLLLAVAACHLEQVPLRTAWRVIPMRFLYRPLLSLAVLYALLRALRGTWVGWGTQERWGLATWATGRAP